MAYMRPKESLFETINAKKLMLMDVRIYSVKTNSQTGIICVLFNDNEKRPEPQDTQLGVSKTSAFYRKF